MDMNCLNLTGNLTADPEAPRPAGDSQVVSFRLASSGYGDDVMYIDCSAFGKTGEIVSKFCVKGGKVALTGRLKYEMWDDKNNPGQKRSKHSFVVEKLVLLGKKKEDGGEAPQEEVPAKKNNKKQPY